MTRILRFADLAEAGIVRNWPQLRRLIDNHGFPSGYHIASSRVWDDCAVDAWLEQRRQAAVHLANGHANS
jgi:predicted DNA-binding transcriptional regulator AlpA